MNKTVLLAICLILLHTGILECQKVRTEPSGNPVNAVNVAATPETEALTAMWVKDLHSPSAVWVRA